VVILVLTACATLVAGNDAVTAIRQWAAGTPQDVLHRLGARFNPLRGRYAVPSERTFRRVLAGLDGDALDAATCGYAADVVRGDAPSPVIAAAFDEPAEREQRRAATRTVAHPAPAGLLPAVDADLAGPQHLNHYARGHWVVENHLHWTREVAFHEDDSQLRTGTAPRAIASFRNLSLNTFRLARRANIAHARRDLHDRTDAFTVYGI
jgi:predicted transposase YbfD/YdcC